jgi:hypothetical protein
MVLRQSGIGWMQACSVGQSASLAVVRVVVEVMVQPIVCSQAIVFPIFFKVVCVVRVVDYVATAESA